MSRKLEKFVSDNRNEFDDALPSDQVWKNVADAVIEKKKRAPLLTPFFKWGIAATLLITAGVSLFLMVNNKPAETPGITEVKTDTVDINSISPEYAPQVFEIVRLVGQKQDELRALAPEQPELYRQFTTDITQLDSSYHSLKSQLRSSPNPEMIMEAMIQNLQLQLNVLNQQLYIINQIKQAKKV